MEVSAGQHQGRDVETFGVALEHAVGEERMRSPGSSESSCSFQITSGSTPSGRLATRAISLSLALAEAKGARVAGIEHACGLRYEVDSHELPARETAVQRVGEQGLIGLLRLLLETCTAPAGVA